MNRFSLLLFNFFVFITLSCKQEIKQIDQSETVNTDNKTLTIPKDENKDRLIWQKPETVVALIGDMEGKTVADIGAGTGYFTFRLALKASKVLAIDIVPDYLEILNNLKEKLPIEIQNKIETRLANENDPLLKSKEVDIIVIINTFSVISDKLNYLKTAKKGLKNNGKIFIVDFKSKNIPIDAPEIKDRLPINELENYLDKAGFSNIVTDDTTLDYQYVVIAENKK